MKINAKTLAYLGMMLATMVWGLNFVVVKMALRAYPVMPFLFLRFAIGGLVLLGIAMLHPHWREGWRRAPKVKILGLSVVVAVGYVSSALALRFGVSPGLASMLSAMILVVTPSAMWALGHRRPDGSFILAIILSAAALSLVGFSQGAVGHSHPELGVTLMVVSVFAFSAQIMILERLTQSVDLVALAGGQLVSLALLFGVATVATGTWSSPPIGAWPMILFSGLGASGLGFGLQAIAQKHVDGAAIAAITALEPGYAMVFAAIMLGASLPPAFALAVLLLGMASVLETTVGRFILRVICRALSDFRDMPDIYRAIQVSYRASPPRFERD